MSFIIFSVEKNCNSDENNRQATSSLAGILSCNNVNFKFVTGCYKNTFESSCIVSAAHEGLVAEICQLFNQDCYLKVDDNRNASLVFCTGDVASVGLFQNVAKSVAESLPNYTKDGNSYWVASKELYPKPAFKSFL